MHFVVFASYGVYNIALIIVIMEKHALWKRGELISTQLADDAYYHISINKYVRVNKPLHGEKTPSEGETYFNWCSVNRQKVRIFFITKKKQ